MQPSRSPRRVTLVGLGKVVSQWSQGSSGHRTLVLDPKPSALGRWEWALPGGRSGLMLSGSRAGKISSPAQDGDACPGGAEPVATGTNCPRPGHHRFHPLGWLLPPEEERAQPPLAQPRTSARRACLFLGLSEAGAGHAVGVAPSCPGRGPGAQTSLFLAVGRQQGIPGRSEACPGSHAGPPYWSRSQLCRATRLQEGQGQAGQAGVLLQPAWTLGGGYGDQRDPWEAGPEHRLIPLVTQVAVTPFSL